MLQVDEALQLALRTHQEGTTRAVATYQGAQVKVQVEQNGTINFNGDAQVQAAGSVTAIGFGNSLVPKSKTDPLGANGQELSLWRDVRVRDQVWSIPLGIYRIQSARDAFERVRSGVVLDWSVGLELQDRFEQIKADDFLAVDSPVAGSTVWSEVRRLSPIPVQQAITDLPVPPGTLYQSRIAAIDTLMTIIGATPTLTRAGVLSARTTDAWLTATTPVFDIRGTITWSDDITNDFYNQVQVSSSSDSTIVAYAQISDESNPLSVARAGGRTYKHSSSTITTVAEAQEIADTMLRRLSYRRSRRVNVRCTPEALLLELGDVGWMRDTAQGRSVFGEVATIGIPVDTTDSVPVTLIVGEEG